MKIAHIAPPWIVIPPKNYGGTEAVIYNLVEAQVAQGHDVTLFASGDSKTSAKLVSFFPRALLDEGVPWSGHPKAYYHLHMAVQQINEQNFDIVHTHLSSSSDIYLFPLVASLATPHITTLHSMFPFDRQGGRSGAADNYYVKEWASNLPTVAISESARAQVPYPLNFVGVVHHGLLLNQYHPPLIRFKPHGDYFAWIGRFSPEKGAHLAIEAAKRASVPLVLGGTIDRASKQATSYFYDTIKPQIDDEQIRYRGPVNMRQKVNMLSQARGFLNPIEWEEPFGMVMIEAMAMGCPVISFARGAAPEIIVHGETGFLVQNIDEMIEYIPRVGDINRDTVRQHVEDHFSARVMAERYAQVYDKVINSSKGSLSLQR